jgi:hypothetical protein
MHAAQGILAMTDCVGISLKIRPSLSNPVQFSGHLVSPRQARGKMLIHRHAMSDWLEGKVARMATRRSGETLPVASSRRKQGFLAREIKSAGKCGRRRKCA